MSDFSKDIRDPAKQAALSNRIKAIALGEAVKYAVGTGVIMGGATLAAMRNHNFNKLMSISAKVSLPTMASLGVFAYKYEIVHFDAMLNPEKWGLADYTKGKVTSHSHMPLHHRVANWLHDNPFYIVTGLGVPLAAFVLHTNLQLKHLTLSQKIMHSRVYAQAGILSILLVTMGFRGFMDKRGRFPEPGVEEDVEERVNYSLEKK
mmetsp:Transcript_19366/g.43153  ORF Transcript_19366/g.43153 Transcript_19366/m.43153 type:complete len:205 (+) Transcript_19366:196-810(+)